MSKISRRTIPAAALAELTSAGIDPILAKLYASRGMTDKKELDLSIGGMIPPSKLKGAVEAAKILADAIENNLKIVISCDFDVDGCSAGSIGIRALKMMGAKQVDFAMPQRQIHGYGLSPLLVRDIHAKFKPDLILTVDCGISSFEGVDEATRLGVRVLITDHHLVGRDAALPKAVCIVNPNQPECEFPSKHLAGAGVIFYVMLALRAELRSRNHFVKNGIKYPNLATILDLVALATVADVVKLDHNNRILVQQGIARIRNAQACDGINALFLVASKQVSLASTSDIGFIIGPRLNAAGRLEDMTLGVQCLTTDDAAIAANIATRLSEINVERRKVEAEMKSTADVALENINVSDGFSLVMFNPSWHQGVIGILASRLKDQHGRPTIVFAKGDDGKIKGSGRSIPGLHLRDAIDLVSQRNPGLIPAFGGHAMAAGLTCYEARFAEFVSEFERVVRELISEADLLQMIETDGDLHGDEISVSLAKQLDVEIWGQGFPTPLFDGEFEISNQKILKDKHLKISMMKDGKSFDGIWFFHNEPIPPRARLVYSLNINEYNGDTKVQMLIRHAENIGG